MARVGLPPPCPRRGKSKGENMATKNEKQEINLADVQAQIAAMLAEAKAEAQKIIDEAKSATGKSVSGMTAEELAAHKAKMNEEVEIKLFRDSNKYRDDVFVSVNGETIAIKRGERVRIKRKFAEVLDNSEHQDYETAQLIEKKSNEFEGSGL
jgi:predicted AAA+ superfamily ATPase